jgi:hypothetical protein
MRNGGIGRGWYEDYPESKQITEHEIELNEFFKGMLKDKLTEVSNLIGQRHKERCDAVKEREKRENFCKEFKDGIERR